jgi:S1-C subfamily serine protease
MVTEGIARRSWLGIIGLSITEEIARYYGLPVDRGVLVTKVAAESPAEEAEMTDEDIILEIDNVETSRIEDLVKEIHKRKVGDIVRIFALRNGREHFFELKLSEAP